MELWRLLERGDRPLNVNESERWVSVLLGGTAVLLGASRRSMRGGLLAAAGAVLIHRGVTGHCYGYGALDVDSLVDRLEAGSRHDIVEEAGEESFPASDPPAWPSPASVRRASRDRPEG